MSKAARITGLGSYLPQRVMTNRELETLVDTTDEWIVSRTGIKERRIAAPEEAASDLGVAAARQALQSAGIDVAGVDFIIACTMTADYCCPSAAALIQHKLGAPQVASVDLQAACTGYIYGLSMAKAYVESGMARTVLVVATEKMSSVIDFTDRNTCVLFGDGASAAVVQGEGCGLLLEKITLGADGEHGSLIIVPGGGSCHPTTAQTVADKLQYFRMNGKEVFKSAVRRMSQTAKECLAEANLTEADLSWIVPHQANMRITDALAKSFTLPYERIYKTVQKYGNTSGSSVAIALDELTREHPLNIGERVLLVAFGGGLTWGAAILKKI